MSNEVQEVFVTDENGEKVFAPQFQPFGTELGRLQEEFAKKAKSIAENYGIELDTIVQFNINSKKLQGE